MSSRISWPTTCGSFRDEAGVEAAPQLDLEIAHRAEQSKNVFGVAQKQESQPAFSKVRHKSKPRKNVNERNEKSGWHEKTLVPDNNWGIDLNDWGMATNNWEPLETWAAPGEEGVKWGIQLDNWALLDPYDRLRDSALSRPVPMKKRVKRWMRDIARAEGLEFAEESGLDDDDDIRDWTQWGAGGDDWKRPPEEWGFPVGHVPLPVEEETDPRATADFKFVEKIAKKRGLKHDRRRLHVFYRLPTDEKVSRIQEIVQFIHSH